MTYWPPHLPRSLPRVETTLPYNLRVTAARYGSRTAIGFFGRDMTWRAVEREVEAFAGWLRRRAGLSRGDRVVLFMQNSPQWFIAYWGTLRADCVAVPVNPMTRPGELKHLLADSGAKAAVVAQELLATAQEAATAAGGPAHIVAVAYADYLPEAPDYALQDWVRAPRRHHDGCVPWAEVIAADLGAPAPEATEHDLALLPYTSGSTGLPKGCEHPHSTFQHTATGLVLWHGQTAATVFLGLPPMYQVSGIANCLHCPVISGGTVVPVPRWERGLALRLIERYRVSHLAIAPTACIDMLASPDLPGHDLTSLRRVTAGGAPMPEEVWRRLREATGLPFIEAYGMTEAAATTHINPIERPKPQCLGIAFFDTDVAVVNPETLEDCRQGEAGEILVRGPQMFRGYWGLPKETEAAFVERDGVRWYRSGDIGYADDEGYYFMTDRLKRMINASGFKVWPAEVETKLYEHPDVLEACVVSSPDPYRGETVKAVVTLKAGRAGQVTPEAITEWARGRMAAYKVPRVVEFVDSLPKSPVGKILWRELQDREKARAPGSAP
jgi:fatty-acyl-CoA synthase